MNPEAIIECVPNFSEGTDAAKVEKIVAATQVEGVRLLDWSLDTAHNRSIVTLAGSPEGIVEAAVLAAGKAAELIDLTAQNGVHPRIGAADVIPFIPVSGASLADCAVLARQAGLLIWRRYGIPVYFYGAAAARPDRVLLEDVRRGQFEGLRDAALRDATRRPDIGGPELHETAGASAVGARSFLIAYSVHLQQPDIAAARAIARDVRAANGGLHGVKAIAVLANGRAQVSMNVTDFRLTPMRHVHATVQHLAQRHGVLIEEAELIGLIPEAAYEPDSDWIRQISGFDPDGKVLERRLHSPIAWPKH
ncbi:glutamate formimidoyltransferase [Tunturiibacter gelidoferens]|jgi:glutamate formiminotransferase / 5-formyltetrahydrofolate cyclo-ligase|uniref:glutamate formimidoyltransferase n=1 Tax=Tunturiibacter gelidiferens TaxID=3069689 RepID=A0A9X0QIG5_9BACT|nr:glutamate formimidoyltransferase [Edaphobacter lichenicola]MBB5331053.1 glutamate formiminotransferase [Edaphobacter lichenicola]